jgi:hypothetical protein
MTDVFVCTKCKHNECIVGPLLKYTDVKVRGVRCQKVCDHPVAGLVVNGRFEWFGRLDRAKPMAGLIELVRHGGNAKVVRPLAKRRSAKRSGRPPR